VKFSNDKKTNAPREISVGMTGKKQRASLPAGESLALILRLFRDHGAEHAGAYFAAIVLMGISAAATALSAYLLKPVLNQLTSSGSLELLSLAIACLFALRGASTYSYLVLLAKTGNRIIADVQDKLFQSLIHQDLGFLQQHHTGDFLTRLAIAANGVKETLQVLITSAGRDALTLTGLVAVMIIQDPLLSIVAIALMPLGAYGLGRLIKRVRMLARRSYDGMAKVLSTLQEALLGIRVIKSFGLEVFMTTRMTEAITEVETASNRMAAGMAFSSPIADMFGGLAVALVILYGGWRVRTGGADAGSFFSFIAALLMAYEPAKRLAKLNLEIQNGLVGVKLIYDILDQQPAEEPQSKTRPFQPDHFHIAFDKVCFSYRREEPVLRDLSFMAEAGQTTALVGLSGTGKTTVLALLQRFFSPSDGSISIGGIKIADADLAALRQTIASVSQDVFLFRGTVAENIALGRPGATREHIIAAAKRANAHDFISSFAAGYDTEVGEQGQHLSTGQRQRISIARAMLKDAPILLLDEPTAALDPESEREVQKGIDHLRAGRTTLIITHRLQTIIHADRIIVIDQGRVAEYGSHADLMARCGLYASLFKADTSIKVN